MRTVVMALALVSALLASGVLACGRQTPQANSEGNDAFAEEDYAGALEAYQRAQEGSPDLPEPFYNTGNAQFRQQGHDDALSSYDQAQLNADEELTGNIHFNRGNVHFNRESYGEAAQAYREVLRLNPDDADAKHNLELALRQMQQDQQEQQQQGQQDQEQEEEQQQGGQQEQEDEQEPQGDQQGEQEGEDEQQPDQGGQDEGEQDDQQQQPQPGPGGEQPPPLTQEQAIQLLEAVGGDAETLQEHLQRQQAPPGPPPERDW